MKNSVDTKDNFHSNQENSFAMERICKTISRNKSDVTPKKRYANTGYKLIDKREMISMLENGQSRCAVARRFGVTVTAVTKSLQRMAA